MLKNLYTRLCSLNLGLWLMSGVMLALAVGSFSRGSSESAGLNDMPLLLWLQKAPLSFSWWLWLTVALIALLCLNALLCSIEALRSKGRSIAPHLMHLGFLLVVLAHLFSAYGGFKQTLQLGEGGSIGFPDGERVRVERITTEVTSMGMMSGYRADLRLEGGRVSGIEPNSPLFHKGYGIYLKHVELTPAPVALVEIHREPGALLALLGALFFTGGNLMLLARRK
ncbi:MAG: cytochrome C biogenesis protein ResB [Geobacteraceae bacterium GWC2_58_44]|nr:MAG: cytochrome C biogenesis protein ResB [Geobacteraceae bacterium GWC2_58_44]HBG05899.1 cytochrome C biogenesis protein ResB [Geobacter sp.]